MTAQGARGWRSQGEIKGSMLTASIPSSLSKDAKKQTSLCIQGWNAPPFESWAVLALLVVDLPGELVLGLRLPLPAGSSPSDLSPYRLAHPILKRLQAGGGFRRGMGPL